MQDALGMQRRRVLMHGLPLWAVFHYKDISGDHIISEYETGSLQDEGVN